MTSSSIRGAPARQRCSCTARWLLEPRSGRLSDRWPTKAWYHEVTDEEWVIRFLKAVESDPHEFPHEFLAAALPLVPVLRRARPTWYPDLPLAELAAAPFPKLIVSGGHSAGFDAVCDDLAERIGATRAVVEGAGHEI